MVERFSTKMSNSSKYEKKIHWHPFRASVPHTGTHHNPPSVQLRN
nr:MAG TPA: hypothetical protein [Caudoviricetes sp.]